MKVIRTNPSARSMAGALRHSKSHQRIVEERRPLMFMGTRIWFDRRFGPIDHRTWGFWQTKVLP